MDSRQKEVSALTISTHQQVSKEICSSVCLSDRQRLSCELDTYWLGNMIYGGPRLAEEQFRVQLNFLTYCELSFDMTAVPNVTEIS